MNRRDLDSDEQREHESGNGEDNLAGSEDIEFPPPKRKRPLAIIVIIVLVILLVGSGLAVAQVVTGGVFGSASAPTPTVLPGENLFYITTSPLKGEIFVDGHSIGSLPHLSNTPLELSPGSHMIKWSALPFSSQECLVYVPPQQTASGACSSNGVESVQSGKDAGLQATVISFTATPAMLPSTQHTALDNALESFLHSLQSSDTVQPGEQYFDLNAPHSVATATQPLKAILHFHLDTNPFSTIPCVSTTAPGQSCQVQGSSCYTLCDAEAFNESATPIGGGIWAIYGVVQMSWDYTTLNGQAIATDQPYTHDRANPEYLIPFFVSWNDSGWHIADQLAQTGSIASLNIPPSCYPLEAAISLGNGDIGISRNSLGNITIGNQIQSLYWELYASGSVMASGCLLAASQNPPNPQAPITSSDLSVYNLYRFGMMLTVNSAAHSYFPNLPVVDSYEQQIAQSIAKQNHLVIK